MPNREEVIKALENCSFDYGYEFECLTCYSFKTTGEKMCPYKYPNNCLEGLIKDAVALLKEYEQSEQSYLRTLVELSNERDKLLKELGREDEHKYKDGSFMAGGNGIVKL